MHTWRIVGQKELHPGGLKVNLRWLTIMHIPTIQYPLMYTFIWQRFLTWISLLQVTIEWFECYLKGGETTVLISNSSIVVSQSTQACLKSRVTLILIFENFKGGVWYWCIRNTKKRFLWILYCIWDIKKVWIVAEHLSHLRMRL